MFALVAPSFARFCMAMKFGIAIAARIPMITTTIMSSMRVKPAFGRLISFPFLPGDRLWRSRSAPHSCRSGHRSEPLARLGVAGAGPIPGDTGTDTMGPAHPCRLHGRLVSPHGEPGAGPRLPAGAGGRPAGALTRTAAYRVSGARRTRSHKDWYRSARPVDRAPPTRGPNGRHRRPARARRRAPLARRDATDPTRRSSPCAPWSSAC